MTMTPRHARLENLPGCGTVAEDDFRCGRNIGRRGLLRGDLSKMNTSHPTGMSREQVSEAVEHGVCGRRAPGVMVGGGERGRIALNVEP